MIGRMVSSRITDKAEVELVHRACLTFDSSPLTLQSGPRSLVGAGKAASKGRVQIEVGAEVVLSGCQDFN